MISFMISVVPPKMDCKAGQRINRHIGEMGIVLTRDCEQVPDDVGHSEDVADGGRRGRCAIPESALRISLSARSPGGHPALR